MEHLGKLPEKFMKRIKEIAPYDSLENVLNSYCVKKPTTLRANTLKISSDKLESKLNDFDLRTKRAEWYKDAFILEGDANASLGKLMGTDLYREGYLYVQGLSSMIPPLVLDPQPNETILDIAAAPGSKTTQVASIMKNTGEIIANDLSRVRLFKLDANLKLQGITNTKLTRMPGQILWKKYPQYFDRSLADVPCSLEGKFNCNQPKTFNNWSTKKIEELSQRQKFLLRSAISATKPGGIIVYSTCTLAPEENEAVIDWILKKEEGVEIEPINIPDLEILNPIMEWGGKKFDQRIKNTARILPTDLMEAFYIAKLKKV